MTNASFYKPFDRLRVAELVEAALLIYQACHPELVEGYTMPMRPSRIAGNLFLAVYLPIVLLAFLYTVLRQPIFLHPRPVADFVYGMIAPYQAPIGQHGQIFAECFDETEAWQTIDLAPFYPQMFGERNARELFSMYPHYKSDYQKHRSLYAQALRRTLAEQGTVCSHIRLSWDKWPAMTGGFYASYLPAFTTRTKLYED